MSAAPSPPVYLLRLPICRLLVLGSPGTSLSLSLPIFKVGVLSIYKSLQVPDTSRKALSGGSSLIQNEPLRVSQFCTQLSKELVKISERTISPKTQQNTPAPLESGVSTSRGGFLQQLSAPAQRPLGCAQRRGRSFVEATSRPFPLPCSGLCAQNKLFCLKPGTPPKHPDYLSSQSFLLFLSREWGGGVRKKITSNG